MMRKKNIVCLGGGVGTSNLLNGLKKYNFNFTVITSMADDGGSSGRLREIYNILPPGDIINCLAALIPDSSSELAELLLYRFPGDNKTGNNLDGHKLGNLIMLAEIQKTGNFYEAIENVKKICRVDANLLPATDERVILHAITKDGRHIKSETTLDLALYSKPHGLKSVFIVPKKPKVNKKVIDCLNNADIIISGPGDLYTNQLPVIIVSEIKEALLRSNAKKIFIMNIANKSFETKDYTVSDYIEAIIEHIGSFPFNIVLLNNNFSKKIPAKYKYAYVPIPDNLIELAKNYNIKFIEDDLTDISFPLYHDKNKLSSSIMKII